MFCETIEWEKSHGHRRMPPLLRKLFCYFSTKRMSLDWLKCFLCIALTRISSQHGEEGSDVNYLKIAKNSMMKNVSYSVKPYPNNCACHNQVGEIYNLAPLQNIDGTPRFATNSVLYKNNRWKNVSMHMVWIAILIFQIRAMISIVFGNS